MITKIVCGHWRKQHAERGCHRTVPCKGGDECIKQNSNIAIVLEDGNEEVLRPSDSKKVLSVFDNLNETNQTNLINRLVQTQSNFNNTIDFCSKFKERYT